MTNLFPREALDHFNGHPVVEKIRSAQQNYEARDLLLSVWARLHPELVLHQKYLRVGAICTEGGWKRVIVYDNKVYPFKQSAPHKLVDMFMECMFPFDYTSILNSYDIYNELCDESKNGWSGFLFFCSQKYTGETGIEPYIGKYDEIVNEYIKYLQWKIEAKNDKTN